MKKHSIVLLLCCFSFYNCNKIVDNNLKTDTIHKKVTDTLHNLKDKDHDVLISKQLELKVNYALSKVLNSLKNIKNTKNKSKDWMSDYSFVFARLFELEAEEFTIKTTSYTYKKDCVFYLHTIQHTNDTISIQPFLENIKGKQTEGYTRNRVLIFAMLNDKEANFIDIPEKLNPLVLREELVALLYDHIDSDVIACYRAKKCEYKDLRKS